VIYFLSGKEFILFDVNGVKTLRVKWASPPYYTKKILIKYLLLNITKKHLKLIP
jgi:hypothetical protein